MAHLKCKTHGRRSQVSEYPDPLGAPTPITRILHRSDKTRCDGIEVVINKTTLEAEMIVGLRRNTPQYMN